MLSAATLRSFIAGWHLPGRQSAAQAGRASATGTAQTDRYHRAVHRAYVRFAKRYPAWQPRGFDMRFLHGPAAGVLAARYCPSRHRSRTLCGMDLASLWHRGFGVLYLEPESTRLMAELAMAASDLLHWIDEEMNGDGQ